MWGKSVFVCDQVLKQCIENKASNKVNKIPCLLALEITMFTDYPVCLYCKLPHLFVLETTPFVCVRNDHVCLSDQAQPGNTYPLREGTVMKKEQ